MEKKTNQERFGCKKCSLREEGIDPRFPYCTHKKVGHRAIHRLVLCPKKK